MDKENVTVKAESTGSLLAMNLILMVLSCVLFVGTTLAWFTDQTSGGVNRIQAGNLEAVLVIGEGRTTTSVPLDPPSGAQLVSAGTAVQLQLHKLNVTESTEGGDTNVTISTEETDVWNPGDIFISDVMRVVKASGSVPFDYKLELEIDPETEAPDENPAQTNDASDAGEEANAAESPKAREYIDFRIVDVSTIVSNDTQTYDYDKIAAYFGSAGGDGEGSAQGGTIEPGKTPPTPIWPLPLEEKSEQSNASGSSKNELSFVIIAKIKSGFTNLSENAESDIIQDPFELRVTLKQLKAEHFEPAAKAGDVS